MHLQPSRASRPAVICLLCFAVLSAISGRASASPYGTTRYPLVLVPGAFGFGAVAGVVDYWFNMAQALSDDDAKVYLVKISPLNSTELRGEQLVRQIEEIVAVTGATKVNLIGHSQGGLTARYAAAVVPHLVASVTTIASPHTGSAVADWLAREPVAPGSPLRRFLVSFCNRLANIIGWVSTDNSPNDALAGLGSLTAAGTAAFNAKYPQGLPAEACGEGAASAGGQRFYSWTGVADHTNWFDVGDLALAILGRAFAGQPNDGLVGQCSSHFGHVIRDDYRQNHLDNINHTLGLVALRDASPVELMRIHANRLRRAGL